MSKRIIGTTFVYEIEVGDGIDAHIYIEDGPNGKWAISPNMTVAVLIVNGIIMNFAVAECLPSDKKDFVIGAKKAVSRLLTNMSLDKAGRTKFWQEFHRGLGEFTLIISE